MSCHMCYTRALAHSRSRSGKCTQHTRFPMRNLRLGRFHDCVERRISSRSGSRSDITQRSMTSAVLVKAVLAPAASSPSPVTVLGSQGPLTVLWESHFLEMSCRIHLSLQPIVLPDIILGACVTEERHLEQGRGLGHEGLSSRSHQRCALAPGAHE